MGLEASEDLDQKDLTIIKQLILLISKEYFQHFQTLGEGVWKQSSGIRSQRKF